MLYMLDTNICSYILRNHPLSVKARFDEVRSEFLAVSTIVMAELYYGAARHPKGVTIRREIDDFSSRLKIIPWDETAANNYGLIRTVLEKNGLPAGSIDMLTAAHAKSLNATLVTNNTKHFENVPDLAIVNWVN